MIQETYSYCCLSTPLTLQMFDNNWEKYNQALYKIFIRDFIKQKLLFNNLQVQIRINPMYNTYEHAFIHLTSVSIKNAQNPNDRIPDLRRCERIEWNRQIIEKYPCYAQCKQCQKILYYEHYYKNKIRVNLIFVDVRFKVILELREHYVLLITGYYIEFNHTLRKEIQKVNQFKKQKTPLE